MSTREESSGQGCASARPAGALTLYHIQTIFTGSRFLVIFRLFGRIDVGLIHNRAYGDYELSCNCLNAPYWAFSRLRVRWYVTGLLASSAAIEWLPLWFSFRLRTD